MMQNHTARGMVLSWVLLSFLFLAILIGAFTTMSRQTQSSASRFQLGEAVRQVLETGAEEVFARLVADTADADSPTGRWFRRRDGTPWPMTVPLAVGLSGRLLPAAGQPTLTATVRLVDFRGTDSVGNTYYNGDGVGTCEIRVKVDFPGSGRAGPAPDYYLVQHHEFRLASLLSDPARRSGFAPNSLLDFAWFSRRGWEDFQAHQGEDANSSMVRFRISQEGSPAHRTGAIFFGGTEKPGGGTSDSSGEITPQRAVFLNTTEAFQGVVPPLPSTVIHRIGFDDLSLLFPLLTRVWNDAGRPAAFRRLTGTFSARNFPLCTQASGTATEPVAEQTRQALLATTLGPERNGASMLDWVTPAAVTEPDQAEKLFRGALRQRFLYLVQFSFDPATLSGLPQEIQEKLVQLADSLFCLPPRAVGPFSDEQRAFSQRLAEMQAGREPSDSLPLLSALNTDFVFKPGQTMGSPQVSFPCPVFHDLTGAEITDLNGAGGEGLKPFPNVNLYAKRYFSVADMQRTGQYDPAAGLLHLRGVTRLYERFVTDRPLRIRGRGVLIANGISLGDGVSKSDPDDLAIFIGLGPGIRIDTSAQIQAALLAFNAKRLGTIFPTPGKTLRVLGSLVADSLTPSTWPPNLNHHLAFDPHLRPEREIWSISLSSTVIFRRMAAGEENP